MVRFSFVLPPLGGECIEAGSGGTNCTCDLRRMKPTRYCCATPRCPRRDSNPHDASKDPVGKTRFPAPPSRAVPGGSATLRSPHLTQLSPQTAPAAALVKQVHAPRFSRYQPSVFWSPFLWLGHDVVSSSPFLERRGVGGAATGDRTQISSLASSCLAIGPWPLSFASAEGFEPSSFPVTVGRLTVRPR